MASMAWMGSWWDIEVGSHRAPVWGKNYVPDELMLLFADDDLFIDQAKMAVVAEHESQENDDVVDTEPASWNTRLMHYATTAGTLRMRLELQGFSSQRVRDLSAALFDEEGAEMFRYWPEGRRIYPNGAAITAALATRRGQQAASGIPPEIRNDHDPDKSFLHSQWESVRESFDDPRFALALSLSRTRPSTPVILDLTDLVLGGWLTTEEQPHREARSRMSSKVAASGPVIVITEGSSDARWIRRSLEIASPEVAHFFEFLDFAGTKSPGGTDRVVSLTKGMAAAGVMNRIVAVLDNDTAGNEATQQLTQLGLPARVVVVNLPAVEYAKHYPTIGPDGPSTANVNGRAASIEFMFGEDILHSSAGSLFPVRWQTYNERVNAYQGRLDSGHKKEAGRRIDQALSASDSSALPDQVVEGCQRLSEMLIRASGQPLYIPASEASVLTAVWRNDPFCAIDIAK